MNIKEYALNPDHWKYKVIVDTDDDVVEVIGTSGKTSIVVLRIKGTDFNVHDWWGWGDG